MSVYIQRRTTVKAVQLLWSTWSEMCEFADVGRLVDGKPEGCYLDELGDPTALAQFPGRIGMKIPTKGGLLIARETDWVIDHGDERLRVMPDDEFTARYQLADKLPIGTSGDTQ